MAALQDPRLDERVEHGLELHFGRRLPPELPRGLVEVVERARDPAAQSISTLGGSAFVLGVHRASLAALKRGT
jgi:hypothetical protein